MIDHQALIASLPAEERAALTERSDRAGLRHLSGHVGAILGTSIWIAAALPLWPIILVFHGILLVFLFTLEHECTHKTTFRSPWINEVAGHLCSLPLVLPFQWFRYFHLAHHRYTNDPENDPELAGDGRPDTWRAYTIYISGWSYWRNALRTLMRNALGWANGPYLPKSRINAITWEARTLILIYILSLASAPQLLFWLWLLPMALGMPFLRLYLLAEHGHCPPVANMLENTRTTYTNRIIRRLAWNMPYHAEHHAYPSVPFHKLPEFHTTARAHLKSTSDGYVAFTKSYVRQLDG